MTSPDPRRLATFWSELMGLPIADGASDELAMLDFEHEVGPITWILERRGDVAVGTAPIALDIGSQDEAAWREVADRAEKLGAARVDEHEQEGVRWIEMRDPDGNRVVPTGAPSRTSWRIMGRVVVVILAAAWSDADESEPAVAAMNRMPEHVVTSTLDELGWQNSHLLNGDSVATITDLKCLTDHHLVIFGSGALVGGLAERDLVDEYRLLLFPLILGSGKRMFDDHGNLARFELTQSSVSPSGVIMATYTRTRSAQKAKCLPEMNARQRFAQDVEPSDKLKCRTPLPIACDGMLHRVVNAVSLSK